MAKGRPNVYETKVKPHKQAIVAMRAGGISYEEIAKLLNIAQSTLYKHKAEIEDLSEAIKNGNTILIDELEATMYDLAKGRVKVTKHKYKYDDKDTAYLIETTVEQLPPNLGALIFSLTNLAPDRWKNKQEISMPDDISKKDMEQFDE